MISLKKVFPWPVLAMLFLAASPLSTWLIHFLFKSSLHLLLFITSALVTYLFHIRPFDDRYPVVWLRITAFTLAFAVFAGVTPQTHPSVLLSIFIATAISAHLAMFSQKVIT